MKWVPKLLIGPLFNPQVVGVYAQHPNIKVFTSKPAAAEYQALYAFTYALDDLAHFNDLLAYLPPDWQPDCIIWWDLVYQALPPGVVECPYPTAVIVGDWNLNFMACWGYLTAFDMVLTEKRLCQYMQAAGINNGHYWPGFSFDQSLFPYPAPTIEKHCDVTFVGNLNPYIHPERNRYLARLQQLANKWRICIAHGVYGASYRQLLARSCVVFNHSVRGEMNMRAYEAPACGALLLMEDSNLEIQDFLTDGESCVRYHADDFEDQCEMILSHPERCEYMARQGHQHIQNHHYSAQFEHLLVLLSNLLSSQQAHASRWQSVSFIDQFLHATRQLFFASTPQAPAYALRYLQRCLSEPDFQGLKEHASVIHASATLMAMMGQKWAQNNPGQARHHWQQALEWWQWLWQQWPHPLVALNMGWTWHQQADYQKALVCYEDAFALLPAANAQSLHLLAHFTLPGLNQATEDAFPVAWEACQILYITAQADYTSACCRLLRWHIWQQLGHLRSQLGDIQSAIDAYRQALLTYPEFGDTEWHLAKLLSTQGHENEAWQLFDQLIQRQPFFVSLIEELLTPHLLWHKREPLLALLNRYLETIYTEDAELQKHLLHLQELQQMLLWLHHLIAPSPTFKQDLINYHCPIRLAALLAPVLAESSFTHRLGLPLAVVWQTALPEPCPILAGDAHFYTAPSCVDSDGLLITALTPNQGYHRIYELQPTYQANQLGPQALPFVFPAVEPTTTFTLADWRSDEWSLLLITESLASPLAQHLIMTISQQEAPTGSQPQLLIWNPLGHVQQLDWLEIHWPVTSAWQGLILDEPLTAAEQGLLLQHTHWLIPTDRQWQTYYWYWALWLGTPVWLSADWPLQTYGGVSPDMLRPFVQQSNGSPLADYSHDYRSFKTIAEECQQHLQRFYTVEAPDIRWQTLWRLKVTLLFG